MSNDISGILAPVRRLDVWLHGVLFVLVVTSATRYVLRHGFSPTGWLVLTGAAVLMLTYSVRPVPPMVRTIALVAVWTALTLAAPSFAWCAVPVTFAVLRVVPFRAAAAAVAFMTAVAAGSWLRITGTFDPTVIAGPIAIALVTTIAYRALDRESRERQRLIDELTAAQSELAHEQHRSGVLAERTRLSREIHDSVGQGLSSINLMLQAAEHSWTDPEAARARVHFAAAIARDGLDEVRRVVRDLAPPDQPVVELLEQVVGDAEFRVDGTVVPVDPGISSALVMTARGALANAREHSDASRVVVTLTFHPDEIRLDVRDDGRGFTVRDGPAGLRGNGLRGIRERALDLGGTALIESAPDEGTTVSVRFPLEER